LFTFTFWTGLSSGFFLGCFSQKRKDWDAPRAISLSYAVLMKGFKYCSKYYPCMFSQALPFFFRDLIALKGMLSFKDACRDFQKK